MKYKLPSDTFLEKCDDEFLVYAPLFDVAFTVNESAAQFVRRLISDAISEVPREYEELIAFMSGLGLFANATPKHVNSNEFNDLPFLPTTVYLLLTDNCNLRCTYCFSHGGDGKQNLPFHVAVAACNFVVKNAAQLKMPARVRFHGGGEPTISWKVLTEVTRHFRKQAKQTGVESLIGINTNGVFSSNKLEWIANNIDEIFISFDGPSDIQMAQRPIRGGGDSFSVVWATMESLAKRRKRFAVRSTISDEGCDRMTELVEMLQVFNVHGVELEPLSVCGRAYGSVITPPSPQRFIEAYKKAFNRGREIGVRVYNSSGRLDGLSSIFCGAAGRNFAITPTGNATFCHRVTDVTAPGGESFVYGSYSEEQKSFELDSQKIAAMRSLHCEDSPACSTCFAKWNCAGGCYAQNHLEGGANLLTLRSDRCEITRELIKFTLMDTIQQNESMTR